jgi:glycine betaine/proline transport system substrate-binding protein
MNRKQSILLITLLTGSLLLGGYMLANTSAQTRGSVDIVYVEWAGEIASTNVIGQLLERGGWDVNLISVQASAIYSSTADGSADFTVSAWLPSTQADYWEEFGDKIDMVRTNLNGTKTGLVVPAYMEIDEIGDLTNTTLEAITGIDAGAGIMTQAANAIEDYNLEGFDLIESSEAAMMAELDSAIENDEEIVVTLWSPHWAFAVYDLKYLEDPEGTFGGEEYVYTLARQGLSDDDSDLYQVLQNFYWSPDQAAKVMAANIEEGADPAVTAAEFLDANPELVEAWTEGVEGDFTEDSGLDEISGFGFIFAIFAIISSGILIVSRRR